MTTRTEFHSQLLRYVISGGGLTLFYSLIYWIAATQLHILPLVANTLAFLLTVAMGWKIHSDWSFRGHGSRDRKLLGYTRFFTVNIIGFLLNSFWVWLFVSWLGYSPSVPLIPIVLVTPWVSFLLNRYWTFG